MAEEKRGYRISDIYQGGYSSLVPSYNDYITAGSLGMTTDPRTANILQEVSTKLSSGVKQIEVEGVSPEIFDSIPNQQLKEVHRLSKLTGVDISLHAPVIDVSGIDPRNGFSESDREASERRIAQTLLRSHELNPDGNIPVNFHTANMGGSQFLPPSQREKEKSEYKQLIAINRETGRMTPLEKEREFHPGGEIREVVKKPENRLEALNSAEWRNSLFQVEVNREHAERIMKDTHPIIIARFAALRTGNINPNEISKEERAEMNKLNSAWEFVEQAKISADSLFSKAYDFAKKDDDMEKMKELENFSREYGEMVGLDGNKIKDPEKYLNPKIHADVLQRLIEVLEKNPPKTWVPLEDFAIEKSAESFGKAAWQTYKELKGKNVPILTIENPPAGFALSTGKDVRRVVDESRKQFVKKAVSEGFSEKEANKEAEKLIGATWDVGHINMLRKFGYSEKEVIEEAKHVAPILKHIHLSDNFGFEHTELPMGMGNVPLKEIMEKLGQKGYDARKIIEAGHWWQHFRTPPFQETLEAVGSPIYEMEMAPYWSQAPGLYQGYFGGYGQMLPQINYETFGAGFSRLPAELGGQVQGAQGNRMSGRPME